MQEYNIEISSFAEFSKAPIFRNLENISSFSLLIELPRVFSFSDTATANRIATRMFDAVLDVLDAAGFHYEDRLRPVLARTRVGVAYDDDEYGFEVYFDTDGDLRLNRTGSSFERFHNWYVRLMPSVENLVSVILVALSEEGTMQGALSDGRALDRRREIRPLRAQYSFTFVGYNFRAPPSDEIQRNLFVMRHLFGGLPSESGSLTPQPDNSDKFGRTDYAVSRWRGSGTRFAREVYRVEAPGNRRFSSVWLSFAYIGETYDSGEGDRVRFDSTDFLKYYEIPYMHFLKSRALESFVADLTKGMTFDTSAGTLP